MTRLIYFSNVSENTHIFVSRLEMDSIRIPVLYSGETLAVEPFVLIVPTYGSGKGAKDYVPKQVKKFLKNEENSSLLRGVISSGNTNFGEEFALAGNIISRRFDVPFLYRFEISGMPGDKEAITDGLKNFWIQQKDLISV